MSLIVQKYGGTSVGSVDRIKNVALRIAKWSRAGHQLVVVPSAMSKAPVMKLAASEARKIHG